MMRENPTTVRLSENVQKIKDKLSPIYGLKNILSAGLILFSKLPPKDREKAIAEASGAIEAVQPKTLRDAVRDIVQKTREKKAGEKTEIKISSEIIKISPSENDLWNKLRKLVEEKPKRKIKKA